MSLTDQKSSLFGKAKAPATSASSSTPNFASAGAPKKPELRPVQQDMSVTSGLSSTDKARKIAEAKVLSEKATKHLETSVFK